MGVYLRAKFEVSSIIITGFRQGVIYPYPPQNEPLKSSPRLGLNLVLSTQLNKGEEVFLRKYLTAFSR